MKQRRSLQEWVLWLELGAGARWVRRAALMLGVALLSLVVGYKQFRGPLSETTLGQAAVGRQVAQGDGFTTPVNYPQTLAVLKAKGPVDFDRPWPELHQPPLYSAVIAGALAVLPDKLQKTIFANPPVPPGGFAADYVLLSLNVALLWLAAWLTFLLGRHVFDALTGLWAVLGLLVSVSIWEQTVAVNGTPLMMVLLLGLFYALQRLDAQPTMTRGWWSWPAVAGVFCGLLFLGDYSAGIAVAPVLFYVAIRSAGRARVIALSCVAVGFLVVIAPWLVRNVALTGNPFALAGQSIALKAGDPTAEPALVRNTLSAAAPLLDLNKLGNKGLTALQAVVRDRLWSGGGMFFTALFTVGFLYRFRAASANRLRWLFVVTLMSLVSVWAFFDSGEGERLPVVYAVPLIMIFGAGFFAVLIASSETLAVHARGVATLLLLAQAVPLLHDVFEPRRLHFNYPPYYPGLFVGMRDEMTRRGGPNAAWMADVPAGAAWYSGQRVWAQPATLRDFYAIGVDRPMLALVLTPHTLDKPFFSELTRGAGTAVRLGEWAQVYAGLVSGRFPPGFPLMLPQKVSDNLYVLVDPLVAQRPGK